MNIPESDSIFVEEQEHLTHTYTKLEDIGKSLLVKLAKIETDAADTKKAMADELTSNFATYDDAIETYADIALLMGITSLTKMSLKNSIVLKRCSVSPILPKLFSP